MAVESSTNSAAALQQRTAVRRSDLRAARSFSGRELVQSIFDGPDRGLSADHLQGPPSGSRPRAAKTGRGAGTGDGRRSSGTVQRVRPARWPAIACPRAPNPARASASGCCAGTTSFSGSLRDGLQWILLLFTDARSKLFLFRPQHLCVATVPRHAGEIRYLGRARRGTR